MEFVYRNRNTIWVIGIVLSISTIPLIGLLIPYLNERVELQSTTVDKVQRSFDIFTINDDQAALIYNLNPQNKSWVGMYQSQAMVPIWSLRDKDEGRGISEEERFKLLLQKTNNKEYNVEAYNTDRMSLLTYLKNKLDRESQTYQAYKNNRDLFIFSIIVLEVLGLILVNISEYCAKRKHPLSDRT